MMTGLHGNAPIPGRRVSRSMSEVVIVHARLVPSGQADGNSRGNQARLVGRPIRESDVGCLSGKTPRENRRAAGKIAQFAFPTPVAARQNGTESGELLERHIASRYSILRCEGMMWAKSPGTVVTRFYHSFIKPSLAPSSSLTSIYVLTGFLNPSSMGSYVANSARREDNSTGQDSTGVFCPITG